MSFSNYKAKYESVGPASGINRFEIQYLKSTAAEDIDDDQAVERFVDSIREAFCNFAFKEPLKKDFYTAKDHALNCLEITVITPRQVHYWIGESLKCMDVLLIVYIRDVLKGNLGASKRQVKERDVYTYCQGMSDDEFKCVGEKLEAIYQNRSALMHPQIIDDDGVRQIKRMPNKRKMRMYEFARGYLSQTLDVLVPKYRKAFPEACTENCK